MCKLEKLSKFLYSENSEAKKVYGYLIVKPNGEKHFSEIVDFIKLNKIKIEFYILIKDYEYVNTILHPEKSKEKFIVPINKYYKDFYSNRAVLLVVSTIEIPLKKFLEKLLKIKFEVRKKYAKDYVKSIFDISKLGITEKTQTLNIVNENGSIQKDNIFDNGNFLIIDVNEVHSPDDNSKVCLSEMKLLLKEGIICKKNILKRSHVKKIKRFKSFF